jgi:hypothetical protein
LWSPIYSFHAAELLEIGRSNLKFKVLVMLIAKLYGRLNYCGIFKGNYSEVSSSLFSYFQLKLTTSISSDTKTYEKNQSCENI